jgi:hypothetical protein
MYAIHKAITNNEQLDLFLKKRLLGSTKKQKGMHYNPNK